ncbi:acyltransferase family protein [Duganella sp. FT134W]|uniref:Acyltransferase family protein n=1 Tax=Duganella margarita TaxID=2692170 RepID=A0A7X4KH33_9BURK|nr:acyltransferase family protein [Duganella margarita]MYM74136.1 acyltransferase family protein [Duganella margarita]
MIDAAKGIGILLIVLGHNPLFDQNFTPLADLLSAFRLPFFFFISGTMFTVGKRSLKQVVIDRADAWLKPVVVVVALSDLVYMALGRITLETSLLGLFYETGFTLTYVWTALWFLPHLWLLYVTVTWVMTSFKSLSDRVWKKALIVAALLLVGDLFLKQFAGPLTTPACHRVTEFKLGLLHCGLPFSADLLLLTAAFFLLGHFMAAWTKQFKINGWLLAGALAVMSACQWFFDADVDFNFRRYDDLLICTLQAFSGIYLMLCVCSVIARFSKPSKLLAYFGRGSLFILIFHAPIVEKTIDLLSRFVPSVAAVGFAAFILPVLLSLLIWNICRRVDLLAWLMLPRNSNRAPQAKMVATHHTASANSVPPQ